jgi:hypothetical protein
MRNYPDIGVQVGEILLPGKGIDLNKWAVIACDQFTSQPEYWETVHAAVGGAPSTLHMILPEVYLGTPLEEKLIHDTQVTMRKYLEEGLLVPHEGLVLVEREVGGRVRRGLMLALDLERYDFRKGSQSLIRATEGTIVERLPPRIRIREGAPLEAPHILVLIDDPRRTVIEPVAGRLAALRRLYDVELMAGSGRLRGYLVDDPGLEAGVVQALRNLAEPAHFQQAYGVGPEQGVLLFAMGDGNHSLATAKSIWEKVKATVGPEHPARYALVEVENVHDAGLAFEPIHRVLFGIRPDWKRAFEAYLDGRLRFEPAGGPSALVAAIHQQAGHGQAIGVISAQGLEIARIQDPPANLPVGTLQGFLDEWLKTGGASRVDYVHGDQIVIELGRQPGNLGFYLPPMEKSDLFKTVILDGSLPRKTFSMGEAHEKRFYMESRRISGHQL